MSPPRCATPSPPPPIPSATRPSDRSPDRPARERIPMTAIDSDSYTGLILRKQGWVLHAELNNPGRKNALNHTMIQELHRLWTEVDEDDDVHVVVLSGH